MTPQRTILTRMPSAATSLARPSDSVSTAPLLAEKCTQVPGAPVLIDTTDESITIPPPLPPFLVESRFTASREQRNEPKTLVRNTDSSSSIRKAANMTGSPANNAVLTQQPRLPS